MVAFPTFAAWAALHGKVYNGDDETLKREAIYNENVEYVQANNHDGTQGPSMFMDWTREEFAELLGLKPAQPRDGATYLGRFKATGAELPDSIDWVDQGAVSLVKDQGRCGSCWAFSAVGALEGRAQVARGGEVQQFSEQQLVDCDTENDGGCQGGLMDYAFTYAMDAGACTEESYGYGGKAGTCASDSCSLGLQASEITGFQDVDEDIDALKEALTHGPVSVAVDAMTSFQFYFGGIVSSDLCGAALDHGVLAVGYGSEKTGLFGKVTNYWKVKNSWGSGWGENGYIRLNADKGGKGQCGILSGPPSYPIIASGSVTV